VKNSLVSDARRKEILENRKQIQRLNREIVEGEDRAEVVEVKSKSGKDYTLVVHALTDLAIAKVAQKTGLSLSDLIRTRKPSPEYLAARKAYDEARQKYGAGSIEAVKAADAITEILRREAAANPDPKALEKMQFVNEIVAAALTGNPDELLSAEELSKILPGAERNKAFQKVIEISGLATPDETVEKFHAEPQR
jgi:hypothetical protein